MPYGRKIERNIPDKEIVIENFKKLSEVVGAHKSCQMTVLIL